MTTRLAAALSTIAFVCSVLISPAWAASQRPMVREEEAIKALLLGGKFDELERIAVKSRSEAAVISDGQPLREAFFAGTAGCACSREVPPKEWEQRYERIKDWIVKYPKSPEAKLAEAQYFMALAWGVRGHSYASDVDPSHWRYYEQMLEKSREHLDRLPAGIRSDRAWYSAKVWVALAQGWPKGKFEALFEEAVKKYPNYFPLYFAASNYYSPMWHGSTSELRTFIDRSADRTSKQLGETLYARLAWNVGSPSMFADGQANWARMKLGFRRMTKDFPDPWNVNNFAKFACMANDHETVIELAGIIGGEALEDVWGDGNSYYLQCTEIAKIGVSQRNRPQQKTDEIEQRPR
jgi:Domain of unknown function (DUF4034)